jgi:hypothetical protein
VRSAWLRRSARAIVTRSFEAGPERNRAVGMWGAMGALGASSGAARRALDPGLRLAGHLRRQRAAGRRRDRARAARDPLRTRYQRRACARATSAARHFDLSGAVLVTAGLVSLTYGIVRTDTLGWDAPGALAPLACGLALLAAFLVVEARVARVPLVSLPVLRSGQLPVANVIVILVARVGVRSVISAGMLCATAGPALLVGVGPHGWYLPTVLPGAMLSAIGMGFSLVPATIVAMHSLPASQSGLGSGLLNTSRLVGGALGLAVLSTLADAQTRSRAALGVAHALTDGFDLAFAVGAALTLLGALVAVLLLRHPAREPVVAPVQLRPTYGDDEREGVLAA